jgi:hypothetical protein
MTKRKGRAHVFASGLPFFRWGVRPARYALTIVTFNCAVTSRWSLTGTADSPRVRQQDLAAIDVEALLFQQVGNVAIGDRTVERVVVAHLAGDLEIERDQPIGQRLRGHALFTLARFRNLALTRNPVLVGIGRRQRQLPRQQIVAGIPIGDLDDVAAVPDVLHVIPENDFHVPVLL